MGETGCDMWGNGGVSANKKTTWYAMAMSTLHANVSRSPGSTISPRPSIAYSPADDWRPPPSPQKSRGNFKSIGIGSPAKRTHSPPTASAEGSPAVATRGGVRGAG